MGLSLATFMGITPTIPDTEGFRSMAVRVMCDSEDEIESVITWVNQFEQISAIGSWHSGLGDVGFLATNLEQFHRLIDYVASWDRDA